MIQRIQSVYLLLTALLMGASVFLPLFKFVDGGDSSLMFYSCGIDNTTTWGVIIFAALSALLAFINIFLYKKRKLQIKLGLLTALFIVVYYVAAMVYLTVFLDRVNDTYALNIQIGIILPVIALIFDLLAVSKIKKDEKLVRSLDRIR